jgi:hypothetical protein
MIRIAKDKSINVTINPFLYITPVGIAGPDSFNRGEENTVIREERAGGGVIDSIIY